MPLLASHPDFPLLFVLLSQDLRNWAIARGGPGGAFWRGRFPLQKLLTTGGGANRNFPASKTVSSLSETTHDRGEGGANRNFLYLDNNLHKKKKPNIWGGGGAISPSLRPHNGQNHIKSHFWPICDTFLTLWGERSPPSPPVGSATGYTLITGEVHCQPPPRNHARRRSLPPPPPPTTL